MLVNTFLSCPCWQPGYVPGILVIAFLWVFLAEFLHVKPGKGAAFVRTKLKNYISGNVVERTFRAGESATQAVLEKRDCQFTYQDGEEV